MSKSLGATASAPLVGSALGSLEQNLHAFFKKGDNSVFNSAVDFMPSFQVEIEKSSKETIMEILEKFRGYYPPKRTKNFRETLPDTRRKGN